MMGKQLQLKHLPVLFLVTRIILILSLPLEGIQGYGDFWNFYQQNLLGLPFLDYWTEFPPLFPLLSSLVFRLVGGREQAYIYLLAMFFSAAQAGTLAVFLRLKKVIVTGDLSSWREGWDFALTVGLFYGWAYYDPLAVFFLMAALYWYLKGFSLRSGAAIAVGTLTKWFPALVLPAIWRSQKGKRRWVYLISVAAVVLIVWILLWAISPDFTAASLISQGQKGSWETLWALIDGNLTTGLFHAGADRTDPLSAAVRTGNTPAIPPWLTLLFFGGLGVWILFQVELENAHQIASFTALTQVLFFLWSPGYSPQWILYLLPFFFLCLPKREAILFGLTMVLIHLLEWPVLLSRGWFWSLNYLIPLRTLLMGLAGIRFYQLINVNHKENS